MAGIKVPVDDTSLAADRRWQLVQRVVTSPGFEKSPRLKAFFLYVTEKALQDHPEETTEQQIGVHVFGRPPGYDSGSDNVVRSQARQLRVKLEQYFATEGRAETTEIVIPKGTYLPSFVERPPLPVPQIPTTRRSPAVIGLAAATMVLSAICIWQAVALRRSGNLDPREQPGAFWGLWSNFFRKGQDALVVIPDHTYGSVQASAHREIPLSEYLGEHYGTELKDLTDRSGLTRILPKFYEGHLTGAYAVTDIARISRIQHLFSQQSMAVRWPRDISMRDFNSANLILIGARNCNPWVELFENSLNFEFRWDPESDYNYCVNRSPRPGESAEYHPTSSGEAREVYGGVAFVSTPHRRGNALLILGTSMAGAEIAAEFITNDRLCSGLLEQLKQQSNGKLPYFEVLLKTTSIAAQASRVEIVAYRIIPD
jgi:hypothetical protein